MNEYILQCNELTKKFGSKTALSKIDIKLKRGKITGLLGPNGSGKTTLIKLANGLLHPDGGEIFIDGKTPGAESKAIVSYLPEKTYLNDYMTVKEIIQFFCDFYSDFDKSRALDMLARLGINENDKLKTMSKGTKEKVQLILVMSRRAQIYFLDEPIAGVDPAARDYILETIITNYDENSAIVISTHLIADVEKVLDEVIFLKYGEIVMHKSVDEIREDEGKSVDMLFREVFKC